MTTSKRAIIASTSTTTPITSTPTPITTATTMRQGHDSSFLKRRDLFYPTNQPIRYLES